MSTAARKSMVKGSNRPYRRNPCERRYCPLYHLLRRCPQCGQHPHLVHSLFSLTYLHPSPCLGISLFVTNSSGPSYIIAAHIRQLRRLTPSVCAIAARFVAAVLQLCHSTPRQLCSASASIGFHSFQYQSVPRFICRFNVVAVAAVPLFQPSSDEYATSYPLLTTALTLSAIPLCTQTIIPSCSPFIVRL